MRGSSRGTRLRLWREHLERFDDHDADLLDPVEGFAVLSKSAADLDQWHRNGELGPRPPGHLRPHDPDRVSTWARWPASAIYRVVLDPDGRPRNLRARNAV